MGRMQSWKVGCLRTGIIGEPQDLPLPHLGSRCGGVRVLRAWWPAVVSVRMATWLSEVVCHAECLGGLERSR